MAPLQAAAVITNGFFEGLAARRQPLLHNVSGTLRFDVMHGDETDCWYITIAKGDVAVTREEAPADAIIRVRDALFDDILSGRANAMAALLRGDIGVEGNPQLLMRMQRTFPGPEGSAK
jgi:putative sterol carrier protein